MCMRVKIGFREKEETNVNSTPLTVERKLVMSILS